MIFLALLLGHPKQNSDPGKYRINAADVLLIDPMETWEILNAYTSSEATESELVTIRYYEPVEKLGAAHLQTMCGLSPVPMLRARGSAHERGASGYFATGGAIMENS